MTDQNQYSHDDYEFEETPPETPQGSGNKTFIVSLGIVVGIFLITLAVLGALYYYVLPQSRAKKESQQATLNAQRTATAMAAAQSARMTQLALLPSATPPSPPTAEVTSTPLIAQPTLAPAGVQGSGFDYRTATLAALLTQAAINAGGSRSTALPATGFFDEVGLPVLVGLAILLALIIFIVRRLRASTRQ